MIFNKKKFITLILIILGFFWFINFFFLLLRNREHSNMFLIIFFYLMFFFQVIYILRYSENKIFKYLKNLFEKIKKTFYLDPLNNLFEHVFKPLPYIGDILLFFCNGVVYFYKFLGFYSISLSCVLFFIIPNLLLSFIIFFNVFLHTKIYIILILTILYSRFCQLLFFILLDFCALNKKTLKKYLIIREVDSKILFDFTSNTENQTQEKLTLYAKRYMLFQETQRYLLSTTLYYEKYYKGFVSSLLFTIIFLCSIKFIFKDYIIYDHIYFIIFFIIFSKELNNNNII